MLTLPQYLECVDEFDSYHFENDAKDPVLKGLTPKGFNGKKKVNLSEFDKFTLVLCYDALAEKVCDATNGRTPIYIWDLTMYVNDIIAKELSPSMPKVEYGYVILTMHHLGYALRRDSNDHLYYNIAASKLRRLESFK